MVAPIGEVADAVAIPLIGRSISWLERRDGAVEGQKNQQTPEREEESQPEIETERGERGDGIGLG